MKILYFAPMAFDDLKQRPQELAEALSKQNDVWYIEPTVSSIGALKDKNLDYRGKQYDISPALHVLKLDGSFALPIRMQFADPLRLNTYLERQQLSELLKTCDVIWIGYEVWERLLPSNIRGVVVYDKMDDNAKLTSNSIIRKFLIGSEKRLIKKCDLIFVTARKFLDRFQTISNVYLIPNGLHYIAPTKKNKVIKKEGKVFGYIGKISHWFDNEAIQRLAVSNPDCDIILVGPCDICKVQMPNVKYIGSVPKDEIPDWICSFDVCLYPFKQNELLDTINPVKIYEYLAYNKPVLAVNSREIAEFKNLVYEYNDYNGLLLLSHKNLTVPFKTEAEKEVFLEQNSWCRRAEQIEQIIKEIKESPNEKNYVSLRNPSGSHKNVPFSK